MASNLTNSGAARVISGGDLKSVCTHLALFSADPGATGSLTNELANSNGYGREAITWSSSGDDDEVSTADITFTASGGDWSGATHWGFVNSATHGAGTVYLAGEILVGVTPTTITVADGGSFTIATGDLSMTAGVQT